MHKSTQRLLVDLSVWAISIVAVAILTKVGVIEDGALGLAAGALWIALRVQSKPDVNTARKNQSEV